jgi:Fe2+ transport system protein B
MKLMLGFLGHTGYMPLAPFLIDEIIRYLLLEQEQDRPS